MEKEKKSRQSLYPVRKGRQPVSKPTVCSGDSASKSRSMQHGRAEGRSGNNKDFMALSPQHKQCKRAGPEAEIVSRHFWLKTQRADLNSSNIQGLHAAAGPSTPISSPSLVSPTRARTASFIEFSAHLQELPFLAHPQHSPGSPSRLRRGEASS